MKYILTFTLSFITIYMTYFIVIINRKKGLESLKKGTQFEFFIKTYRLDKSKLNIKKFANSLAMTNSFIIALTITILEFVDNLIIKLLLCVIILTTLMLIMYKLLGQIYKKKEGKSNVQL